MKAIIISALVWLNISLIYSQTGNISHIQVSPHKDVPGKFEVRFDLEGQKAYNISLEVSFDGGNTYMPVPKAHITGDAFFVSSGTDKVIVWDGMAGFPDKHNEEANLKIMAYEAKELSSIIYYLSDETGNYNLFTGQIIDNKINNRQQLTFYTGNDYVFAYDICKNTGRILYAVTQDGRRGDLYLLETINSSPTLVPNQPNTRIGPLVKWSPDGHSMLFSLGGNTYYHHLQTATMNLDGSNYEIIITTNQPMSRACHKNTILWLDEGLYIGVTPQWAAHATDHDLWFRNSSGTFSKLTNTAGIGENRAFLSPDGTTLVFETLDNSGRRGIRYMPKYGGEQTVIIPHSRENVCWPDGWVDNETIIYAHRPNISGTKLDLYLIGIDGSNAINLSNQPDANIRDAILISK